MHLLDNYAGPDRVRLMGELQHLDAVTRTLAALADFFRAPPLFKRGGKTKSILPMRCPVSAWPTWRIGSASRVSKRLRTIGDSKASLATWICSEGVAMSGANLPAHMKINLEASTVLLVDDNPMSLEILSSVFYGFGAEERLKAADLTDAKRILTTQH